jgi:Uma2 family endonuclease
MRAVVLDMPAHWLEERRRHGLDRRDEIWDGVLHMVPPPAPPHQIFAGDLEPVLKPHAKTRGLLVIRETGVYGGVDDKNFRVPDLVVVNAAHLSKRGVERKAEIAIEILSPDDESRDKLPFYRECGVTEVWLLDPVSRAFDLRSLADGYSEAHSTSSVLGVELALVEGPRLRIAWLGGFAEI